ncbi:MAG: phosphate ABC transporter substrate-binding protein [Peptococcaceae bacterium]|nr:phosphate ABC transporter substrate-binding protein [Peptococcaceae bacterium]
MVKKVKWLLAAGCIFVILAAVLTGCGGQEQKQAGQKPAELTGTITAVGSTALLPLVEEAAKQFMSKNPKVQITVQGGGSGTGLSQVSSGAADIGNSDIFAEEKSGIDASKLVDTKVCVVGMAAVANPKVTVDNLTKNQLIDIFTGKVTNWKEVGGPDQKIVVINRAKGSGTRATFKAFALDGKEETTGGMEIDSSGQVKKTVSETPGAISYLALSYVDNSVKALKLDGVAPTEESITDGRYPVWAYEHMYTLGQPAGEVKAFLDYMLTDEIQAYLVPKLGYIPVTKMKVTRDAKGNATPK